jgi:hypothetical protein
MLHLRTLILPAVLTATIISCNAEAILAGRAACSSYTCPTTDTLFYPLGHDSGPVGGALFCTYPDLSRCEYSTVSVSVISFNNLIDLPQ